MSARITNSKGKTITMTTVGGWDGQTKAYRELRHGEPILERSAYLPAAAAAVYRCAHDQLMQEIGELERATNPPVNWRRLVPAARVQRSLVADEHSSEKCTDTSEWPVPVAYVERGVLRITSLRTSPACGRRIDKTARGRTGDKVLLPGTPRSGRGRSAGAGRGRGRRMETRCRRRTTMAKSRG